MTEEKDYAGMAALSICEALLLALKDREVLPESEIIGILRDAAATHENAAETEGDREMHLAVARLIDRITSGRNTIRRS